MNDAASAMNTIHILTLQVRNFAHQAVATVPSLVLAIAVAIAFFSTGGKIAEWIAGKVRCKKGRPENNILILIEKTFRLLFIGLGIFLALSIVVPSLKFHDLIALLGIGGVAVGFAFRDVLQNFFAGVVLLLSRTFEVGDRIESGSVAGTVEEIAIRSTIVRTDSGDRIIIPNGLLMTREITHLLRQEKGKVSVAFYVPADAPLGRVMKVAREVLSDTADAIEKDGAQVDFQSMTEKAVLLKASWRTVENPPGPLGTKEHFIVQLQEALDRVGVAFGLGEDTPAVAAMAGLAPQSEDDSKADAGSSSA